MKRVAIYGRYSSDRQNPRSAADQIDAIRRWLLAREPSWTVEYVYRDEAKTATTRVGRRGLANLVKAMNAHQVNVVVVEDLSRLSRDVGDTSFLMKTARANDVTIIGIEDGVDTRREDARMMVGMRALMNEAYVEALGKKVRRGLTAKARAGFHTGGKVYGYDSVIAPGQEGEERPSKILTVNGDEAAWVRKAFELYTSGWGYRRIADHLNQRGVPNPRRGKRNDAGAWAGSTIREVLRNERYRGRLVYNQYRWIRHPETGKRRRLMNPMSEWIVVNAPELRIVDDALWFEVQRGLEERSRAHTGKGGPSSRSGVKYLLSGLLRCGACGGGMTVVGHAKSGSANYQCQTYRTKGGSVCSRRETLPAIVAEDAVLAAVRQKLLAPGVMKKLAALVEKEIRSRAKRNVAAERKRLREVERQVANLVTFLAGGDSLAVREKLQELEAERTELQAILSQRDEAGNVRVHPGAVTRYLDGLRATLETDPAGAHRALRRVVDSVTVHLRQAPRRGRPGVWEADIRGWPTSLLRVSAGGFGKFGSGEPVRTLANPSPVLVTARIPLAS